MEQQLIPYDWLKDRQYHKEKGRPGRSVKWISPEIAEDHAFDRRTEYLMERHYEAEEKESENSY